MTRIDQAILILFRGPPHHYFKAAPVHLRIELNSDCAKSRNNPCQIIMNWHVRATLKISNCLS